MNAPVQCRFKRPDASEVDVLMRKALKSMVTRLSFPAIPRLYYLAILSHLSKLLVGVSQKRTVHLVRYPLLKVPVVSKPIIPCPIENIHIHMY